MSEQNRLSWVLPPTPEPGEASSPTLRLSDLQGRVLTIERNLSLEVLGPTKSRRTHRLTIGATTAAMVHEHFDGWDVRLGDEVVDDWVFAPDYRPIRRHPVEVLVTDADDWSLSARERRPVAVPFSWVGQLLDPTRRIRCP